MKQLFFLLLFISTNTFSQNFDAVDAKVLTYPKFNKVENLANKINQDFKTDAN